MKNNTFTYFIRSVFLLLTVSLFPGCKKGPGLVTRDKPEIVIDAQDPRLQASTIYLSQDTVYVLATNLNRSSGQSLVIEAGTLIKVNDRLSITIEEGANITAEGTKDKPVIFTSSTFAGAQGLQCRNCTSAHAWSGIVINGNATSLMADLSSGTLQYVRIEFAGSNENEGIPSLLLNNVNQQTILRNIQVSYSSFSASFELRGGNVNAFNWISYASNRSDFYIHGGYTGMMQNILAYRHPYFPNSIFGTIAGLYIDGDGDSATAPVISNMTVLGPDLQPGTGEGYFLDPPQRRSALLTTGACRFQIRNSVFMGFPKIGFFIDEHSTARALHFAESEFYNNIIHSNDTSLTFNLPIDTYKPFNSSDFKSYMLQARFSNRIFADAALFQFTDPFNYDILPNPMPGAGSPLLEAGKFDTIPFQNSFFERTDYIGAIGKNNWTSGWTNFIPLQTHYNN